RYSCIIPSTPTPTLFPYTTLFRSFPGQDLDVYVQKANNLQVWNEKISPTRRYAILRLNQSDEVVNVRVVTGETLAALDATGTLTDRKSTRLNSSHVSISYAVFCLK